MRGTSKPRWRSTAVVGGISAAAAAAALVTLARPRDPSFELVSITLTSFKLNFPVIDTELILTVHVTNPNLVPIHYSSTTMSIFYDGSPLGSAAVESGSQPPRSCKLLHLPARLDGLELAHHGVKFLADVAKREMVLDAKVDIEGRLLCCGGPTGLRCTWRVTWLLILYSWMLSSRRTSLISSSSLLRFDHPVFIVVCFVNYTALVQVV
ncbi:hypothetical protein Syun_016608 [Stephania yunnanensis]|uniref:Water stress and hypersensitive response domain-containing protein n=1 Tax=Stephania yunnanensis TaxID=152371 RepID=A0AAP0P529_9MAGN